METRMGIPIKDKLTELAMVTQIMVQTMVIPMVFSIRVLQTELETEILMTVI